MLYEEMTADIERQFDAVRKLRETKGKEYASVDDTLADFKEVAAEVGITPLQCWATYVKKHLRAIDTYIREGHVKSEAIESRIQDVLTYYAMLPGLIRETVPASEWLHSHPTDVDCSPSCPEWDPTHGARA